MMFARNENTLLRKIILTIVALVVLGVLVYQGVCWTANTYLAGRADTSGPTTLDTARQCVAEGKTAEAVELLKPIAQHSKSPAILSEALLLLGQLSQQAGATEEALGYLRRAATEFPGSPEHPKAAISYARLLETAGKQDEAAKLFAEVRDSAPPDLRAPALTGLARKAERAGDLVEARNLYRQAVNDAPWNSPEWNEAADGLGKTNIAMIFSPKPVPDNKIYIIESGDSLTSIGRKLNTTQGILMRANGVEEKTSLRLGQQLRYTPKDFRIVIERSTCRLFLFDKEGLFKRYIVGLGMPGHETTLGAYKIGDKQKDPVWHKPGAGPIPAGDPSNELGTRWMPFVPVEDGLPKDLGVHGTIAPETIGKYSSHGCARMYREDIEELYDLVVRSTPVAIVETLNPDTAKNPPA
jgi:lipoprotein-anchoring transpeptidase ErfK/SrfK